jgi:hypothetical protein
MPRFVFGVFALAALCAAQTAPAGDTAPQTAPAPAPAANPEWSVGPINFSGLVDGYWDLNFNHPSSGVNNFRNFDVKANQFSLNMAKLTLEHTPDPLGFRVDLGFGRAFDTIHSTDKSPDVFRYLEQAYISFKPPKGKGFQLDFGEFVTSAGAEVIETHTNWNYSRSLLFAYALPYYHFGLRATMPVGSHFTGGVQLVNGWNSIEDINSGKTLGLTGAITGKKVTWSHNYYVGPEKPDTNKGQRQLYDTTLLLTPSDKANFNLNFDYGTDKRRFGGRDRWVGSAGAARFQLTRIFALSPRLGRYYDATGFTTGTMQKMKEFTLTGEFKMKEGVLVRTEYRRDWSDNPVFDRGVHPASWKNQDTVLVGFVAFFGPKR